MLGPPYPLMRLYLRLCLHLKRMLLLLLLPLLHY
jgi:hypothetical protein